MTLKLEERLQSQPGRLIRATILYDELPSVLRAKALCEYAATAAEPLVKVKTDFWRFDFLNDAAQRKQAANMARRSDLVVLSARNQSRLRPEVECCINDWLESAHEECGAFAVLFASPASVSSYSRAILGYWHQMARDNEMPFYCELPKWQLRAAEASRRCPPTKMPTRNELIRCNLRMLCPSCAPALRSRGRGRFFLSEFISARSFRPR
jgi:hypothetical protein